MAAVKSMKYHLKRVISNTHLTYDELYTLLCQVEFYLNSRPLIPLSNERDDLQVLTPGHFLTGNAMMSAPEATVNEDVKCYRTRWLYLQSLQQHIWKR